MSNPAFDPSTLLSAADEADQTQLTELEKEVAVLGGKVVQLVRDIVESIRKDDQASVADQIQNAQHAKAQLAQANAQLRQVPERRSESQQPAQVDPPASHAQQEPAQAPAADSASSVPAKKVKKEKKHTPPKKAVAPSAPAPQRQPVKKVAVPPPAKKAVASSAQAPAADSASSVPAKKVAAAPALKPPTFGARLKMAAKKAIANLD